LALGFSTAPERCLLNNANAAIATIIVTAITAITEWRMDPSKMGIGVGEGESVGVNDGLGVGKFEGEGKGDGAESSESNGKYCSFTAGKRPGSGAKGLPPTA
jgi:hypothetical protein